jgi:hypothetical protein
MADNNQNLSSESHEDCEMMPRSQRSRVAFHLGVAALSLGTILFTGNYASSVTDASDAQQAAVPNLREVLPEYVPMPLSGQEFQQLGKNWETWSTEVTSLLEELYTGENSTPARQQEIIAQLKVKLGTIDHTLGDPRYSMIYDPLVSLRGKLSRRIALAEAVTTTLSVDPIAEFNIRLKSSSVVVLNKLDTLKKFLKKIRNGDPWIDFLALKDLEKQLEDLSSDDATKKQIAQTLQRVNPYEANGEVQKNFVSKPEFTEFAKALNDYNNILVTGTKTYDKQAQIAKLKEMLVLVEDYEELPLDEKSVEFRKDLRELSMMSPDGGDRILKAIQTNYMNYNFRVMASEGFLKRISQRDTAESGPVMDCVLGARVSGNQFTNTTVNFDFKPSTDKASFVVNLSGHTRSNTTGVTSQATVRTQGNHYFNVTRGVTYDGDNFALQDGKIWVDANNNIYSAQLNNRGLLTRLLNLDSIALERAREMRGQTEAIAAARVKSKVMPRFTKEIDDAFERSEKEIDEKIYSRLKELELYPDALGFQSTEDSLLINARLMGAGDLGGDRPSSVHTIADGATVHLHQSWMNNAVDTLKLAGRTMDEEQVANELEGRLSILLGRKVEFKRKPKKDAEGNQFIFAEQDPVRFVANDGQITFILTAGLKRPGKDDIPIQRISVPISFQVDGDVIHVVRGDVSVEPLEPPRSVTEQIARAGVMRNKIQESIPDGEFKRHFDAKLEDKTVPMMVNDIKFINGWMILTVK